MVLFSVILNIVIMITSYIIIRLFFKHIHEQNMVIESYRIQASYQTEKIRQKNLKIKELEKNIEVIE